MIPARLNLLLLTAASGGAAALLWGASHARELWVLAVCAVLFSFVANTLFALLHEAVHGILHPRRSVNRWAGRLAAAWFPTGFAVQRAFHETHHRNNRTPLEQFDVLHEGDIRWLKVAQWYSILTGLYWLFTVVGVVAYLLLPGVLRVRQLRSAEGVAARQTSSTAYLAALEVLNPVTARLEIVGSLAFQAGLFLLLDLSAVGWLACYGAFAVHWSSLQYADHAYSPLDRHEGAWNLRANPISRAFFLNYHDHRAHHREPTLPWIHLPRRVDREEPRPGFGRLWLAMWRGPVRAAAFTPAGALPARVTTPLLALPRGFDAFAGGLLAVGFALLFFLLYGGASALSAFVPWRLEIALPFEAAIPLVPAAAMVYLSLNLLLGAAPFVLRRWREMWALFAVLVTETVLGALCFLLLPVQTSFPERSAEGVAGFFLNVADTLNLERNFLPSLHVAFAVTVVLAYRPKLGAFGKAVLTAWTLAIAASTVLIHEHHLLDVLAGAVLALLCWRWVGAWARRPRILRAVEVELLCLWNFAQFSRRHLRYAWISTVLLVVSLPRWRERRVLRTGFCFLQWVDDLLDGDRPSEREPLEVVEVVVPRLEAEAATATASSLEFQESDLHRLARAFAADLREVGGAEALADAIALLRVMQQDRRRVLEGSLWDGETLLQHHRRTFTLSLDLLLTAARADVRSSDVPELIEAFGWCSTMRDLREDLDAGLVNVPREVIEAAGCAPEYGALMRTEPVRRWMREERARAAELLEIAERRLEDLKERKGVGIPRLFWRSIRRFARRRWADPPGDEVPGLPLRR